MFLLLAAGLLEIQNFVNLGILTTKSSSTPSPQLQSYYFHSGFESTKDLEFIHQVWENMCALCESHAILFNHTLKRIVIPVT